MMRRTLGLDVNITFDWRSPLKGDNWAEYRDSAFLIRIGLAHLKEALAEFWPARGPQWDGLARTSDGKILLFEGKAHVRELDSSCGASSLLSRRKIEYALNEAKSYFGVAPGSDWLNGFYQYCNRLAHLHFLRSHGVPADLIFIYFVRDEEMRGPSTSDVWRRALQPVYQALGIDRLMPLTGVSELFIDVGELRLPA
jgi:hypothetical protein